MVIIKTSKLLKQKPPRWGGFLLRNLLKLSILVYVSLESVLKVFFWFITILIASFSYENSFAKPANSKVFNSNQNMTLKSDWKDIRECKTNTENSYFKIGSKLLLKIPTKEVDVILPESIDTLSMGSNGYEMELQRNIACEENPLSVMILSIKAPESDKGRTIAFRGRNPNQTGTTIANGLNKMREASDEYCTKHGDIIVCPHNENVNGAIMNVAYIMDPDKKSFQISGAPLHIRCLQFPNGKVFCSIRDNLYEDVTIEVHSDIITPLPHKLDDIKAADKNVKDLVSKYIISPTN